jgi:hypothetical protein
MRLRTFISVFIASVALASIGVTAFAAGNGERGKSSAAHQNHGGSTSAPSSSHDPSNPDGTYRGKSSSTPDQDGTGADHGIVNNDKTGAGTDGNNGCGNDADREDDNNGWCGRKAEVTPTPTSTSGGNETEVLGETFTRPKTPSAEVLGASFARTGTQVLTLAFLAAVLIATGFAFRAIAKAQRTE